MRGVVILVAAKLRRQRLKEVLETNCTRQPKRHAATLIILSSCMLIVTTNNYLLL